MLLLPTGMLFVSHALEFSVSLKVLVLWCVLWLLVGLIVAFNFSVCTSQGFLPEFGWGGAVGIPWGLAKHITAPGNWIEHFNIGVGH